VELVILLFVLGFLLLLAEVYLPGLVAGFAGAALVVAAVVLTFVKFGVTPGLFALWFFAGSCGKMC